MSLFRRAFSSAERRAVAGFPWSGGDGLLPPVIGSGIPSNSALLPVYSGATVTDATALGLAAYYACVRLLADGVAALPWDGFRTVGSEKELIDPAPSLLREPSTQMTVFDFKHVLMVSMLIRGNFYGLVTSRDRLEYPTSILPLHPDWVYLDRDPKTWELRSWVMGERIPNQDLFHIRAFTLPGYDVGLSPVSQFRQSLGLGLATEEYGSKWFRDGAAPSSVLSSDQPLTEDQVKLTQKTWIASHGGKRLPAVLGGGFKFQPITITPNESQFLETRRFQVTEIARIFGVPPHMIGDMERSTSWGTGIEGQALGFVKFTLAPWLNRIEAAMNRITPRGTFVKFNLNALLRGDMQSRYEAYQSALDGGWMNSDEVRALEDLPPIPGGAGQKYRQPLNFGPLGADPADRPGDAPPAPAPKKPKRPNPNK